MKKKVNNVGLLAVAVCGLALMSGCGSSDVVYTSSDSSSETMASSGRVTGIHGWNMYSSNAHAVG